MNKIDYIRNLLSLFFGKINILFANMRGVEMEKNQKFYGRTYFKKNKYSKIIIGNNCTFRSSKTANWIGINHPCMISTQGRGKAIVKIGNDCGFSGTVIAAFKDIEIGNNVRCGANTIITDSDWHLDDYRIGKPKKVTIEDNVWLGVNSVVLKGVRIGVNSIIGVNSVVTSDIPDNVIAAGNPCVVVKKLF